MPLSLLGILSSIAIFLLCFLAIILLSRSRRDPASAVLGLFLLFNGLNFLGGLFFISDQAFTLPSLVFWTNALPLTFGPLIWLYTKSIIRGKVPLTPGKAVHFLPFLLVFLTTLISYQLQPMAQKQEILRLSRGELHNSLPVIIITLLFYLHVVVYIVTSVRDILRYRNSLKDHYSSAVTTNVRGWIGLLFLYAAMLLVALVNSLIGFAENTHWYEISLLALSFSTLLFASYLTYRAIIYPFQSVQSREKYSGSTLDKSDLDSLEAALDQLMTVEKIYREPQLSIDMLADKLSVAARSVSQVINQRKGMNFFDYINSLRIEEACRQLISPDKTVLEIMYDAGFNSKSSFHTAFRRNKQLTPTEYRKKMSSTS